LAHVHEEMGWGAEWEARLFSVMACSESDFLPRKRWGMKEEDGATFLVQLKVLEAKVLQKGLASD